jgi:hypothetical protein
MAMNYRRLALPTHPMFFLVLQAIVFLVGILFLGWHADAIVVAYFFETVIIGLFHIIKMLIVYFSGNAQREALRNATVEQQKQTGFFLIPFFCIHYFFFLFVQSVFMFMFISNDTGNSFNVIANYAAMLQREDVQQAVLVSCFTHAAMTMRDFILPKLYHEYSLAGMFFQPYGRVLLQQIVVILSGFFFMLFNGALVLAILLILFRTALDAWMIKWGRGNFAMFSKERKPSDGGFI